MKIILTGTPGTGKTSLAQGLGKLLHMKVIDVNAIAKKSAVKKREKVGKQTEIIVNLNKLRSALLRELKEKENNSCIVEGHLACEVNLPADVVVVLRCSPFILRSRLKKRGYAERKIAENVLAEALDYCLIKAEENYRGIKILQIDATRRRTALQLAAAIRAGKTEQIDWGKALAQLAKRPSQGL